LSNTIEEAFTYEHPVGAKFEVTNLKMKNHSAAELCYAFHITNVGSGIPPKEYHLEYIFMQTYTLASETSNDKTETVNVGDPIPLTGCNEGAWFELNREEIVPGKTILCGSYCPENPLGRNDYTAPNIDMHLFVRLYGASYANYTSEIVAIERTTTTSTTTTTTTTIKHESCTAVNKPNIVTPDSPVIGAAGTTVTVKGDWMHGPDVKAKCSWVFNT
jgi:hypothetical protein